MFKYSALLLVFLYGVNCQIPYVGQCPNVTVKQNFDLKNYSGIWYLVQATYTNFLREGKCVKANNTFYSDGSIDIRIDQVNFQTRQKSYIEGYGEVVGAHGEGDLLLRLYGTTFRDTHVNILDTDYSSYSVNWICEEQTEEISKAVIWILTRSRKPSDKLIQKCLDVLGRNNISTSYLVGIDQEGCHFPFVH
ncbi:hypothetical protein HHI36_000829 [Cryptolaemus montrouzieri]|uniref:Lipocalin/cytosolic fatty-acid binding domain-containing protein n=1 Tax=Cryptolaemus montrouzieri TaxID=559131 RepID=A0ABD2P617_9CUCU